MRIVVSGTHASGKSTLIADVAAALPDYAVLPDPFELLDERFDQPGPAMFLQQLRVAADRLEDDPPADLIAERGPLDFLAYLAAVDELGRGIASDEAIERARQMTASALRAVDLLVILPLAEGDGIRPGEDEDLELREATDAALLDLVDEVELVPRTTRVVEITGDRAARAVALLAAMAD